MQREPKVKSIEQAIASLERTCARMERAVSDVRRSLYKWGIVATDDQDAIISRLIASGFVDERRYVGAYVRDKLIGGRWGVAKIRAALCAKRIDRELIDEAIEQNVDRKEIKKRLRTNITKHYLQQRDRAVSKYALRVKLFRRAASQGFEIEMINEIIDSLIDD